jgi:hypothetical protein
MAQIATKAIESPNDQCVASAEGVDASVKARSIVPSTGGKVLIEVACRDSGGDQSLALQVDHL